MYKTTIVQLFVIWVFSIFIMYFLTCAVGVMSGGTDVGIGIVFLVMLATLAPFALIFYTLGWRNYWKENPI